MTQGSLSTLNGSYRGHQPCICEEALSARGSGALPRWGLPIGFRATTPVQGQALGIHRPAEPGPAAPHLPHGLRSATHTKKGRAWALGRAKAPRLVQPGLPSCGFITPGLGRGPGMKDGTWLGAGGLESSGVWWSCVSKLTLTADPATSSPTRPL